MSQTQQDTAQTPRRPQAEATGLRKLNRQIRSYLRDHMPGKGRTGGEPGPAEADPLPGGISADEMLEWELSRLTDGDLPEARQRELLGLVKTDRRRSGQLDGYLKLDAFVRDHGRDVPDYDEQALVNRVVDDAIFANEHGAHAERHVLLGGQTERDTEQEAEHEEEGGGVPFAFLPLAAAASLAAGLIVGYLAFAPAASITPQVPAPTTGVMPAAGSGSQVVVTVPTATPAGSVRVQVGEPDASARGVLPSDGTLLDEPGTVVIE